MRPTAVALMVAAALALGAWAAAQEPPTSSALLRALETRGDAIASAAGVIAAEVYASEDCYAQHVAALIAQQARQAFPPELSLRRDLSCAIFAFDERRSVSHFTPLNVSGWDWWGSGALQVYWRLANPEPEDLRSATARYNDRAWVCPAGEAGWHENPRPYRRTHWDGVFRTQFVGLFGERTMFALLQSMDHRVIGRQTLDGHDCWVVHAWGDPRRAHDLRRLWICPAMSNAVVRDEKISVSPDGRPGWTSVRERYDYAEVAPGVWLPMRVEEHAFPPRVIGRADELAEGEEVPEEELLPVWQWTRRYFLREVTVNQPLEDAGIDALWPADYVWDEGPPPMAWWDELAPQTLAFFEELPPPEPDPLGAAVLEHRDELSQWMMTLPDYAVSADGA